MASLSPERPHLVYFVFALALVVVLPYSKSFTWGKCSATCKSKFCTEAPILRYGKYCGLFYTGCPGEAPCDGLDRCCMVHDRCFDLQSEFDVSACNQNLLDCVYAYRNSGQ